MVKSYEVQGDFAFDLNVSHGGTMRRLASLTVLGTLISVVAGTAAGVELTPRPYAPVQEGPTAAAESVLPYAPGRIIVKFTPTGMARARIQNSGDKSATDVRPTTGLPSLDTALAQAQVQRIVRSHENLKNQDRASQLGLDRWFRLDLPADSDIPAVASRLAADPHLEYAGPDWRAFAATTPNDPLLSDHWGHENTGQMPSFSWGGTWNHTGPPVGTPGFDAGALDAWDGAQGYGDPNVVIAILDSGVDTSHPDLRLVAGYDFGANDSDPDDDSAVAGHGTACAGVAAAMADNNLGIAGIAGGCSIMPLKVVDNSGGILFSAVINAIYYAADNGAEVASMSFGAVGLSTYPPADDAFAYAHGAGVTLLAATGNENLGAISYPAVNTHVIAVGAASPCGDRKRSSSSAGEVNPGVSTDPNGYTCDEERWWGSNYGANAQDFRTAVDLLGPSILPTTDISGSGGYDSGDYEDFFNGTSCATPYVAGVAALVISANPGMTPDQVRNRLVGTAADIVNVEATVGWDRYSGYGMVDAAAAVGIGMTPPLADFDGSVVTGCGPLEVTFTDLSQGDITAWAWDFGDGGLSTAPDPTHMYTAPGIYDVTLVVSGPVGVDTLTSVGFVTVADLPTADFSPAATSGTAPFAVSFTDLSSPGVLSWAWDFGDGATDSIANPVHTFTAPGVYTVSLLVIGTCGIDTLTAPDLITVVPDTATVVADFSVETVAGCEPLEVAFTDLSTGNITGWAWDFGDSATDTVANPVHTYADPGVYDVRLTVSGAAGADTLTVAGLITVGNPVTAAFSVAARAGTMPVTFDFTDESTGERDFWIWDFGDASTDTVQNPTHTYADLGIYPVTLITGNSCRQDTLTVIDAVVSSAASPVGDELPGRFRLSQNVPNPFNPQTTIAFDLPQPARVSLSVYDLSGRLVRSLLRGESMEPGRRSVVWNGKDDAGQQVATGVYLYAIDAGGRRDTKRMLLIK